MTAWGPFKRSEKDKEKKAPVEKPAASDKPLEEQPIHPKPSSGGPAPAPRPATVSPSAPVPSAPAAARTRPASLTEKGRASVHRRTQLGVVLSDKMQQTAVVEVTRLAPHPLYKKVLKFRKRYKAHNEGNAAKTGDRVRMAETRPLSKDKRWRIVEILSRSGL